MQAQAALNSLADGRYLGGKLAFLPHSYLTGDTRADGIYAMGDGSYQVVFDGASVTLVSAVVNLDQLAALFPGVNALQANNGVLTAHVGATTYVVQAGINVGSRAATGTAFLETDAEGYTHFIDAQGNEQVLFPAFREFATLRAALRTQDPFVTLSTEFNGTITMVSRNVTSRLVPDITLIVVPAQRLGQDLWQESSSRWCYANAQFQPVAGRAQCYTVR
jgi:carbon monoxide dehydrogenase subunit G